MKKIIILSLSVLCYLNVMAQKETSWWHFGYKAGLNFNSLNNATASDGTVVPNMPEAIVGPLSTSEGCFTVSTYNGNLLFSSDGSTVYDKNGNVMSNGTGLLGGPSSTQSGIAVPKPGSTTEYYIITVPQDYTAYPNGIRYSIVDISKNAGLGAVTSKNNVIKSGAVYENIAAVPNSNGKDYWLIHRTLQTFYVWAITETGISSTAHQTIASSAIVSSGTVYLGELIVSSDYTKLASFNWAGCQVISAVFNPSTGLISGIQTQTLPILTYSGTFSPNNQYIYISSGYNNSIQVYVNTWAKLRAGTASTFLAYGPSNIKPGIDRRLYGIRTNSAGSANATKHLYVVMNPDAGGTTMKYFPNYLKNSAYLGLPTFAAGFIRIIPKEQPFACTSHNRTYSVEVDLSGGNAPDKLEWYFGDGSAKITQTVNASQSKYSQVYSYNNAGIYTIEITPYKADGTKLTAITMTANIVNCTLKTNRMTRSDLLNSKQQ